MNFDKKYLYSLLSVALLAIIAIFFFAPNDLTGDVLQQSDILQGTANGQEGIAFKESTGETTRWTNSLFGGMPNFQIAPSYPANDALNWVGKAFSLWLPNPANLLFSMMLGFFIMCLCLRFKWYTSLFAAIAWGFSTYFIIIIGAGHIWKFVTLAYIPPTIGGIALCYRKKYLAGTALAALFGALQLQSNHPQMTYYFIFVIVAMILAWLYNAIKNHSAASWTLATICVVVAGILAVAANSASLYNTYEYTKETVRGKATDLTVAEGDDTGGMNRQAITAWSYGIDETFSFIIPNVKGGATIRPEAGTNKFLSTADTEKAMESNLSPEERQFVAQFPQYFGDQPMTNGPVYAGIIVLILAIIALFIVDTPLKWALFAVSLLAMFLSWGHNFSLLTDFFIDNFPAYNKFRAVSSFLVVVEFTIPLLAALCLKKILDTPDFYKKYKTILWLFGGLTAFICLVGWIAPGIFGDPFSISEKEFLSENGIYANPAYYNVLHAVREARLSLVSADALRSLLFILLGALVFWLYFRGSINSKPMFVSLLAFVVLLDLFTVNKRYINSDSFTRPIDNSTALNMTPLDQQILADTSMNYRVYDIQGNNSARSSYFHKTIGGYHAAKLTRYNDLLDHQIAKGNTEVLNMLNTKYFLLPDSVATNPYAFGNAWFVENVTYVDSPDVEMAALDTIDPRNYAVADVKFKDILGSKSSLSPGDTIFETTYAPNKLTYHARNAKDAVAVFSEIYFPWGWKATIDGKPVEIARVDYVLRALNIPSGNHTIEFSFNPESLKATNAISVIAVVLIYILVAGAILFCVLRLKNSSETKKEDTPQ